MGSSGQRIDVTNMLVGEMRKATDSGGMKVVMVAQHKQVYSYLLIMPSVLNQFSVTRTSNTYAHAACTMFPETYQLVVEFIDVVRDLVRWREDPKAKMPFNCCTDKAQEILEAGTCQSRDGGRGRIYHDQRSTIDSVSDWLILR